MGHPSLGTQIIHSLDLALAQAQPGEIIAAQTGGIESDDERAALFDKAKLFLHEPLAGPSATRNGAFFPPVPGSYQKGNGTPKTAARKPPGTGRRNQGSQG